MMKQRLYLCFLSLIFIPQLGFTQQVAIDQIIAQVNEEIILQSDLEDIYQNQLFNGNVSEDTLSDKCEMLQFLIINKMLLVQAGMDSVKINPEVLAYEVQRRIDDLSTYGSNDKANIPLDLRKELSERLREIMLVQKMEALIIQDIDISPQEVKNYFQDGSLPEIDKTVEVGQIIIFPQKNKYLRRRYGYTPSLEQTEAFLHELIENIRTGKESFETATRRYSDDQISRENNGYLRNTTTGSTKIFMDELDAYIYFVVDTMEVGSLSPPLPYRDDEGNEGRQIIYYKSSIPKHTGDFNKDYEYLKIWALEAKRNQFINDWFFSRMDNFFIKVSPPYDGCDFFNKN